MRTFQINEKIAISCKSENARNGFRHRAKLMLNGMIADETTVHYQNRTWESYEFQSVIQKLINKTGHLSPAEKQMCRNWANGDHTDWTSFNTTGTIAQLGNVFANTQEDKNKWKKRMLEAGLGNKGLDFPDDWNTLSEGTKQTRLDFAIGHLTTAGTKKTTPKKSNSQKQANDLNKKIKRLMNLG